MKPGFRMAEAILLVTEPKEWPAPTTSACERATAARAVSASDDDGRMTISHG